MSEYKKTESEATQLHRSFCEPSYVLRIAKIIDYTIPEDSLAGQTLREWQTTILKRGEIIDELIKENETLKKKVEFLKKQRDEAIYSTHFCFHDEFFTKFDEQLKKEFGEL